MPGDGPGHWPVAACKAQPPSAPFFGVARRARHEHLPIDKAALDLTVHFEKPVAGFSRTPKYTLGTEAARASPEGGARLPKARARYKRPG